MTGPRPSSMRPQLRRLAAVSLTVSLLAAAAGCGDSDPGLGVDPGGGGGSDLALLDERGPCPRQLPEPADDDGYGFGTDAAAEDSPALPEVDRAWVCRYDAVDQPERNENGAYFRWERATRPAPIATSELSRLVEGVEALTPPAGDQACTADLGPRYLLVLATPEDRLVAVSVDDYGCREARLTADPWSGAPGETPAAGVPERVLVGGEDLLALLPRR